jgi:hypothetical protein
VPHLYGHFDESGKYEQHPIVSLSGLVGDFVHWQSFTAEWLRLLRDCGLPVLHATEILNPATPFGNLGSIGTHAARSAQIEPFIKSVVEKLNGVAIAVAVDAEAYSRVQELHREFTKDPHYFAFFMVVNNLLTHISIPRKLTVGLIFDDDQEKAMRSYRLLKRLKQQIPEVRSRVTSVCFSDDRDAPQVQAADLFTQLSRLEAMRIFAGVSYPYESLFHAFGAVMPTGEHLCMDARFFSEEVLRTFAATGKIREIVLARRVKLPH